MVSEDVTRSDGTDFRSRGRSPRQRLAGRRTSRVRFPLWSERVILRIPAISDSTRWHSILTRREVGALMQSESRWDRKGVRETLHRVRREASTGERFEASVVLRSSGIVIGRVALKGIEPNHRRAEVAYWFDPAYWGHGLATEAVHRLCRAGFEQLHLHRIDAKIYDFNLASQRLVVRLGFRREGVLRKAWLGTEGWCNELRYGILEGELRTLAAQSRPQTRPYYRAQGRP